MPSGMQDSRFKAIIIGFLGIISAILIGTWLPGADPRSMLYAVTIVLAAFYTFALSRYSLYFVFLAIVLDLQLRPFGFEMSATILVGALLGPVFVLNIWRKDLQPAASVLRGSLVYRFFTVIVLTYSIIHFWFTWKSPVIPFGFSNVAKSYFSILFAFFIILWFALKPPAVKIPKRPFHFLGFVCLIGLLINIAVTLYGTYLLGMGTTDFEAPTEFTASPIFIPFINLSTNVFALRTLGPFTALIATTILTSKNPTVRTSFVRSIYILVLLLSVLGALISMGRATIIFTFALSCFVFLWRRKPAPILILAAAGIVGLASVRIGYETNPEWIPYPIQRTVALIPGMGMEQAQAKISGSSDWRYMVFQMAIKEWQSSSRIFWFGRSTSGITGEDIAQFANPSFKDSLKLDMALKRGKTHNLISDNLIVLGLIGAILFILLWISAIFFMFNLAKVAKPYSFERQIFIVAGIFTVFQLIYSLIGGGVFPIQSAVLVCLGILLLKQTDGQPRVEVEVSDPLASRFLPTWEHQ